MGGCYRNLGYYFCNPIFSVRLEFYGRSYTSFLNKSFFILQNIARVTSNINGILVIFLILRFDSPQWIFYMLIMNVCSLFLFMNNLGLTPGTNVLSQVRLLFILSYFAFRCTILFYVIPMVSMVTMVMSYYLNVKRWITKGRRKGEVVKEYWYLAFIIDYS